MQIKLEGIKVFDPRDGTHKPLANPALIFGYLIISGILDPTKANFWQIIKKMADYCDEHANWKDTGLVL